MPLTLRFATGNEHKFREARETLSDFDVVQYETELLEIKDTDLEVIAKQSLESLPESVERPIFVEDSGLFIQDLNGFPGPIAGYVHEKLGNSRILSLLDGADDRSAYFESVIALQIPEGDIVTFRGRVPGEIAVEERGSHGFDYDAIFKPEDQDSTLAQMTRTEKNEYSHRGESLRKLRTYLTGSQE